MRERGVLLENWGSVYGQTEEEEKDILNSWYEYEVGDLEKERGYCLAENGPAVVFFFPEKIVMANKVDDPRYLTSWRDHGAMYYSLACKVRHSKLWNSSESISNTTHLHIQRAINPNIKRALGLKLSCAKANSCGTYGNKRNRSLLLVGSNGSRAKYAE